MLLHSCAVPNHSHPLIERPEALLPRRVPVLKRTVTAGEFRFHRQCCAGLTVVFSHELHSYQDIHRACLSWHFVI